MADEIPDDDMWIISSFGTHQHWLDPSKDEIFLWPILSDSGKCAFFRCSLSMIQDQVEHAVFSGAIPCLNETAHKETPDLLTRIELLALGSNSVDAQMSETNDPEGQARRLGMSLRVSVFRGTSGGAFDSILQTNLVDIDSGYDDLKNDDRVTFVALCVCSYRLDEQQHVIFGIRDKKIVWEGWTIEELSCKIGAADLLILLTSRLMFRLNKNAFIFSRQQTFLSKLELLRIERELQFIFINLLPLDPVSNIARLLYEGTTSVSISEFNSGVSKTVLNYGIARLLRIGWHRNMTTNVSSYLKMSDSEREREYETLKSTHRSRRKIFNRGIRRKQLRSGHTY